MITKKLELLAIGLLLLGGNCFAALIPRFQEAAAQGDLATIQQMIGNVTQEDKKAALRTAGSNGRLEVVRYLLGQGVTITQRVVVG